MFCIDRAWGGIEDVFLVQVQGLLFLVTKTDDYWKYLDRELSQSITFCLIIAFLFLKVF